MDESETTNAQRKKAWAVFEVMVFNYVIRRYLVGEK
jgi:hypothetical protein